MIADFNNDQINDVAVICNASGAENLGVLQIYAGHANHDGGFETTPMFSQNLGTNPYDIVSDDFNADGRPDLLISVPGANKIVTLLGNKEPSLSAASVNSNSGVFQITYTDADNEAPVGGVNLILDGTSIAMSEVDTSDITYSGAGKVYTSTQTLTVGNHSYRFSANDGTYDAISSDENLAPVSTSQTLTINPPASSGGGCSLSASASPLSLITWAASILLLGVLRNLFRFKKM